MGTVKIGIVGVGDISGIYLKNITETFVGMEIIGVCDLVRAKAERAVEEYKIPKIYDDMHQLFADKEVDIVLNLTRPHEHYGVSIEALNAGKHVYSEKPLSATLEEGKHLVEIAEKNGLMLGGAPDTFMGGGIQTCRKLIDDGFIGKPIGSSAFMVCRGHESWHPDPEFYYKRGGGPMFDMGPYYITALVNLLGAVDSVTGMVSKSFEQRVITSAPKYGTIIDVDVDTNVTGIMQFKNGTIGTIHTTFDVYHAAVPRIEIYGTAGTLSVPDPNVFGDAVKLFRPEKGEYLEIPLMFPYRENSRGLGLADMAAALQNNRDFRASYKLTHHVLEVMSAFGTSSNSGRHIQIETSPERPAPMICGLINGVVK